MNVMGREQIGLLVTSIAVLHFVGMGLLLAASANAHLMLGLGGLAYLLGLRHAFDVDHIAAIDNVTRKLSYERRPSVFVGFWFSLGHSTVVLGLCVVLILTLGHAEQGMGAIAAVGGWIGATVSAVFLTVMAVVNGAILVRLLLRRSPEGRSADRQSLMAHRGLFARVLVKRPARGLDAPWKLYPVGLLFGLGFDTATEIAVLGLSAVAVQKGLATAWMILSLPLLFAAGMTLMDSVNGLVMRRAYGWGEAGGAQRLNFNIVMTGLSVALAVAIAGLQWLTLATDFYAPASGLAHWLAAQHVEYWGALVLATFVACWSLAWAMHGRWGKPVGRTDSG